MGQRGIWMGRQGAGLGHGDGDVSSAGAGVLLYWLPLGAGGHVVRWNGRVYESLAARWGHRSAQDLYHSALEVVLGRERWVIEMAPVWSGAEADRGVVQVGPVGLPLLGVSALFRYEVRCWLGGEIPDADEAVESPVLLSTEAARARQVLALVPEVPALTWGRDQLGAGEMWNSNSLVSWLLARTGHDVDGISLPPHGRAPGWQAGLVLAARQGHISGSRNLV
jgi:hypothetical protein